MESFQMVWKVFDDPEKSLILQKVFRKSSNILLRKRLVHTFLLHKRFRQTCFVAKTIHTHIFLSPKFFRTPFCCRNELRTLFCHKHDLHTCFHAKTIYAQFFGANTIYALFCHKNNSRTCPESFRALKFAIRKVKTFWASGPVNSISWPLSLFHFRRGF